MPELQLQAQKVTGLKMAWSHIKLFDFEVFKILIVFLLLSGVGGIEAEAVMLGQSISMVLPKVLGYKIVGQLGPLATSTDIVLTVTKVCVD